jgi:RES domain-containing protein
MLYCAATASLCALEILAHSGGLPTGMIVIEARVPDALPMWILRDIDLPVDWNASVAPDTTKDLGTKWAAEKSTAILSVPSALVPGERNYLLNPAHPDFEKIVFSPPQPFVFDPRLK